MLIDILVVVICIVICFCFAIVFGYISERIHPGYFWSGFLLGFFGCLIAHAKHCEEMREKMKSLTYFTNKKLNEIISNQEQIAAHID